MTQNKFKKIFVGGLPPQTTESDMREYFSTYGDVCDVVAMRDKTGNKSRGFGFVVFKEAESVDRCQAERPHQLLGKIVDTKRAMPKEESINPDIHCNSKRIFIGGLRRFFTEDDLRNYFKNFGQIVDCTIKRDSVSGASRGFAFITFTDRDIVDKVILSKPHSIRHCLVDVKKAMSPEELRQIDENHNHQIISNNNSNHSEYDGDSQKLFKINTEQDEDTLSKEKNNKKTTKRSQSYPQSDYGNYGYYMYPTAADLSSSASSPTPYPYDQHQQPPQMPLIWMSVQQCADGLILTPIGSTDMYSGTSNYHHQPFYFSPNINQQFFHQQQQQQQQQYNNTNNCAATVVVNNNSERKQLTTNNSSPSSSSSDCDKNGTLSVSELKKSLPSENGVVVGDDCASEETAFGSPNSESL